MPRTGPRRPIVAIRLSEAGRTRIDTLAAERGVNRSEMARLLLRYATDTMPKGWKP